MGGAEWFTAQRSVLIFPCVPCRKHWDVTRQIKSLAQLIRSAQNGWGGDLWLLCEGFWRGGDRRWCDLTSPVWQRFIQNLGIPVEVQRGKKRHHATWMECLIVSIFWVRHLPSHIFVLFFLCYIQLPSREKWNLSKRLYMFKKLRRIESDFWGEQEKFKRDNICRISCLTSNWSECLKVLLLVQLYHP